VLIHPKLQYSNVDSPEGQAQQITYTSMIRQEGWSMYHVLLTTSLKEEVVVVGLRYQLGVSNGKEDSLLQ
jgi:hypothetical protein